MNINLYVLARPFWLEGPDQSNHNIFLCSFHVLPLVLEATNIGLGSCSVAPTSGQGLEVEVQAALLGLSRPLAPVAEPVPSSSPPEDLQAGLGPGFLVLPACRSAQWPSVMHEAKDGPWKPVLQSQLRHSRIGATTALVPMTGEAGASRGRKAVAKVASLLTPTLQPMIHGAERCPGSFRGSGQPVIRRSCA